MTYLILPGWLNSGSGHWQTLWEEGMPGARRVVQDEWNAPRLEAWLPRLGEEIRKLEGPAVLVAHSLGVALAVHWLGRCATGQVKAAFLVSASDVDSPAYTPEVLRNFSPLPLERLPVPSVVVASENDPYVSLERAEFFAERWGSDLVDIGGRGHINAESDLGDWPEGRRILADLEKRIGEGEIRIPARK